MGFRGALALEEEDFRGPGSEAMAPDEEGVRAARAATPVGRRAAGRMTLPRFIHCPPRVSAATRRPPPGTLARRLHRKDRR